VYSDKITEELNKSRDKIKVTPEFNKLYSAIDEVLESANAEIEKKQHPNMEEHFAELRNMYLQLVASVNKIDFVTSKIVTTLKGIYATKIKLDAAENMNDADNRDSPKKIGKPKTKQTDNEENNNDNSESKADLKAESVKDKDEDKDEDKDDKDDKPKKKSSKKDVNKTADKKPTDKKPADKKKKNDLDAVDKVEAKVKKPDTKKTDTKKDDKKTKKK